MTAALPNGKTIGLRNHDDIVNLSQRDSTPHEGAGFRPLLEPVIACINHGVRASEVAEPDVTVIGPPGGMR